MKRFVVVVGVRGALSRPPWARELKLAVGIKTDPKTVAPPVGA